MELAHIKTEKKNKNKKRTKVRGVWRVSVPLSVSRALDSGAIWPVVVVVVVVVVVAAFGPKCFRLNPGLRRLAERGEHQAHVAQHPNRPNQSLAFSHDPRCLVSRIHSCWKGEALEQEQEQEEFPALSRQTATINFIIAG